MHPRVTEDSLVRSRQAEDDSQNTPLSIPPNIFRFPGFGMSARRSQPSALLERPSHGHATNVPSVGPGSNTMHQRATTSTTAAKITTRTTAKATAATTRRGQRLPVKASDVRPQFPLEEVSEVVIPVLTTNALAFMATTARRRLQWVL